MQLKGWMIVQNKRKINMLKNTYFASEKHAVATEENKWYRMNKLKRRWTTTKTTTITTAKWIKKLQQVIIRRKKNGERNTTEKLSVMYDDIMRSSQCKYHIHTSISWAWPSKIEQNKYTHSHINQSKSKRLYCIIELKMMVEILVGDVAVWVHVATKIKWNIKKIIYNNNKVSIYRFCNQAG